MRRSKSGNANTSLKSPASMQDLFDLEAMPMQDAWWHFYAKLLSSLFLATFLGYSLIGFLRLRCRTTQMVWQLTLFVFSTPLIIFVCLSVLAEWGLCDRLCADAISFGSVAGMLLKLVSKPGGGKTIKLIVQQVGVEHRDVWLDNMDGTTGDVRRKISEQLGIAPVERVQIESGRGKILEDMSGSFFSQLSETHKSVDFFGFVTATCYVDIQEEIVQEEEEVIDWKQKDRKGKMNPFKALVGSRAKYGDPFTFISRSAASENAKTFHVAPVDRFAGAATGNAPLFVQIKFLAWSAQHIHDSHSSLGLEDEPDEGGDGASEISSGGHSVSTRGFFGLLRRKTPDHGQMRGKPIHHGDSVVLECEGKFLSVTRGWWLAWASTEPRYSGAFEIEIVERAPQNIKLLKEHVLNLSKLGQLGSLNIPGLNIPGLKGVDSKQLKAAEEKVVAQDPSMRPGDKFRLKSVKYPGFELGITNVQLHDDYFHLGLRKVDPRHPLTTPLTNPAQHLP
ncbi:hypothetical protein B484DRAFT_149131 [Ochromonadaceae sp. CCMP2298]|nr:hypothetical protein B484DRAFT_149131 [Ochromonadaceae sp. CCMP2298]